MTAARRRRGAGLPPASGLGASSFTGGWSISTATASVRPTSSMRTRRFWPTEPSPPLTRDDVAVDLGDGVAGAVHVRLDDLEVDLLALTERQRALEHLLAVGLHQHREVLERQPLGALEVEPLAGVGLDRAQHAGVVAGELRR